MLASFTSLTNSYHATQEIRMTSIHALLLRGSYCSCYQDNMCEWHPKHLLLRVNDWDLTDVEHWGEGNKTSPNLVCGLQLCYKCQSQSRTSLELHSTTKFQEGVRERSGWFWHNMTDHHVRAERSKIENRLLPALPAAHMTSLRADERMGREVSDINHTHPHLHACTQTHVLLLGKARHES